MVDIPLLPIAQTISIREHPHTGTWMKINHDPDSPINKMMNMLTAKDEELKKAVAERDTVVNAMVAGGIILETESIKALLGKIKKVAALLAEAPCDCPERDSGIGPFHDHDPKHAPCFKNKADALLTELRRMI